MTMKPWLELVQAFHAEVVPIEQRDRIFFAFWSPLGDAILDYCTSPAGVDLKRRLNVVRLHVWIDYVGDGSVPTPAFELRKRTPRTLEVNLFRGISWVAEVEDLPGAVAEELARMFAVLSTDLPLFVERIDL